MSPVDVRRQKRARRRRILAALTERRLQQRLPAQSGFGRSEATKRLSNAPLGDGGGPAEAGHAIGGGRPGPTGTRLLQASISRTARIPTDS